MNTASGKPSSECEARRMTILFWSQAGIDLNTMMNTALHILKCEPCQTWSSEVWESSKGKAFSDRAKSLEHKWALERSRKLASRTRRKRSA
jgi:hypothetical protein